MMLDEVEVVACCFLGMFRRECVCRLFFFVCFVVGFMCASAVRELGVLEDLRRLIFLSVVRESVGEMWN